jgi:hypothetical protein
MSLAAITALKARLSTNAALVAYFQAHYGKAARHLVGYSRAPSANDFPSICYVPTKDRRKVNGDGLFGVSLVLGVHEKDITGDVFNGMARLDEIEDLVVAALIPLKLNTIYTVTADEIIVIHDLGARHPFHEKELQLSIKR